MSIEENAIKEVITRTVGTIFEGIKAQIGPSKKELKVKIEDLEEQINELNKNNDRIQEFYEVIIDDLCDKIGSTNVYSIEIDADSICIINNSGQIGSNNQQANIYDNDKTHESSFSQLIAKINQDIEDDRRRYPQGRIEDGII